MILADVASLNIPMEFGCDEESLETESIEYVWEQLSEKVETRYGASKFVIFLDEDPDRVVKIPFNGNFYFEYDEETGEMLDDLRFEEFYNSDYCATEAEKYADAVAAGLEKFFASTKYVGRTADGTPYYVSEKVYGFYDSEVNSKIIASEKSEDSAAKYRCELATEWLAQAIEYYGESEVQRLLDFIDDENIYDLHTSNIGYRKNGAPCILDYSGFDS